MIKDFGKRAEGMGLDSIWMGEHVALFDKNTYGYPGSKDGRIPVPPGGGMLDVTATFGFLAAATSKVRFGTGVALVPQRNPIYTAKEVCTLDWLSDGRFDFGIGVGWNKEEVESCGYKWEDRGARCDEFLEVMRRLWTEPVVDFKGKWVQFETMRMDPKPIQKPHPPIIVGGYADAAFRRAVKYGAGWYGFNCDRPAPRRCWASSMRRSPRPAQARAELPDHHHPADLDEVRCHAGLWRARRAPAGAQSRRPAAEQVDKRLPEIGSLVKMAA
jgi:probable F420-dependent oxidoreductase